MHPAVRVRVQVVHGIGTNDETLPMWVAHLRKTMEPAWQVAPT
jgi:hypothetical protein